MPKNLSTLGVPLLSMDTSKLQRICDLVVAIVHLGLARIELARRPVGVIIGARNRSALAPEGTGRPVQAINFALARAARLVPWRADCLVTAMAARSWARRTGLAYDLHLGVLNGADGSIVAHAWVTSGKEFLCGNLADLEHLCEFQTFDAAAGAP